MYPTNFSFNYRRRRLSLHQHLFSQCKFRFIKSSFCHHFFKVNTTTKYPVMIYIHGGGLTTGDNRIDHFGSIRNFVSRDVVVASLQYRLGLFGSFGLFFLLSIVCNFRLFHHVYRRIPTKFGYARSSKLTTFF